LPNLLIGQHGASQAWPLSQPNVGLQLPKNGSPGPEDDEFYELVYDKWVATTPCAAGPTRRRLHCRRYVLGQTPLTREYRGEGRPGAVAAPAAIPPSPSPCRRSAASRRNSALPVIAGATGNSTGAGAACRGRCRLAKNG
jgi:hypothetical protein